jgi:ribosomal protein S27AE
MITKTNAHAWTPDVVTNLIEQHRCARCGLVRWRAPGERRWFYGEVATGELRRLAPACFSSSVPRSATVEAAAADEPRRTKKNAHAWTLDKTSTAVIEQYHCARCHVVRWRARGARRWFYGDGPNREWSRRARRCAETPR